MIKMLNEIVQKAVGDMKKDFDARIDGLESKLDQLEDKINDLLDAVGKLG